MAALSTESSHHRGNDSAIPTMECANEEDGTNGGPRSFHPRPAPHGVTDDRDEQETGSDPKTTCLAEHQRQHSTDCAMEDAGEPTSGKHHAEPSASASEQCGLADHPMPHQTMGTEEINDGPTDSTRYAEGLPRAEIQTAIVGLRLTNTGNMCWLNATSMAWMWTTSACDNLQWSDFGTFDQRVSRLLMQPQAGGVSLVDHGFNPQEWGHGAQQDSGEYAAGLLARVDAPQYDQTWESRVMTADGPVTLQRSEGNAPTILSLGMNQDIDLQELLETWQSAENRVTAFTAAATCRVFQLDRTLYDNSGRPYKDATSVWIPSQLLVPTYVVDTAYELIPYIPVAVVKHLGQTGAGHFKAGLRAGSDFWLETDDGRTAGPVNALPDESASDILQIWLVRRDRHAYTPLAPPPMRFTTLISQLRDHMQDGQYREVQTNRNLRSIVRSQCVQCRQWVFTKKDHLDHVATHHPGTFLPYEDYEHLHATLEHIPCRWCSAWNVETHDCLALWQALVARTLTDTEPPFDVVAPGAMAAHRRDRLTQAACGAAAGTLERPALVHAASNLPLHSALAELATPIVPADPPEAFWRIIADQARFPEGHSPTRDATTSEDSS